MNIDNHSWRVRFWIPTCLMLNTVLVVAGIDMYLPTFPYLVKHFQTQEWQIQMSLMLSPAVSAFSGFFFGHYADLKGRKSYVCISIFIFSVGSFFCAHSFNIESFLLSRMIQAIGSGGMAVLSLSVFSDLFKGDVFARYLATYGILFPVVFAIAPLLGGYLFTHLGWRAPFYALFIASLSLGFILYFVLFETKEHAKITSNLKDKLLFLTKSSTFMGLVTCHGLPLAILQIYIASSPFIWMDYFGLSVLEFSYVQVIPIGFNLAGAMGYRFLVPRIGIRSCLHVGYGIATFFCCLGLLLPQNNFIFYLILMCVFSLFLAFFIVTHATLAMDFQRSMKGVAAAHMNAMRNFLTSLGGGMAMTLSSTPRPVLFSMIFLTCLLMALSMRIQRQ